MHSSTLFVSLLSASTAFAMPPLDSLVERSKGKDNAVSTIDLPASTLPAPPSNMTLKYVVVGLGTQNYTCKSTPNDANSAPASNGAVATLYDAAPFLSQGSPATKDTTEKLLSPLAISLYDIYKITPDKWSSPLKLKTIGQHYFTPALVPTFDLHYAKHPAQIQGKKAAGVPAPADACPGIDGEGAVDWLQLADNGSGYTSGTPLEGGLVYRVETAGGKAPKTCDGQTGDVVVKYAAEYFFYGPSSSGSC